MNTTTATTTSLADLSFIEAQNLKYVHPSTQPETPAHARSPSTTEKYFYFAAAGTLVHPPRPSHVDILAAVLLLYDFLLTVGAERACFWRRRLSGAAALFLVNRYLTLFLALYNAPWWDILQLEYLGTVSVFEMLLSVLCSSDRDAGTVSVQSSFGVMHAWPARLDDDGRSS